MLLLRKGSDMMNRFGFTLIELLATITILGLLMMVAVPNVISTIDKNKQATYINDAKKMITLAEYKIRKDTSIDLPKTNKCIIIKLSALDLSSFEKGPEGGDYDTENSYVVLAAVSVNGNIEYKYFVTLLENFNEKKRGLNFVSREKLNEEDARKEVKILEDSELDDITIGSEIRGYTITHII